MMTWDVVDLFFVDWVDSIRAQRRCRQADVLHFPFFLPPRLPVMFIAFRSSPLGSPLSTYLLYPNLLSSLPLTDRMDGGIPG